MCFPSCSICRGGIIFSKTLNCSWCQDIIQKPEIPGLENLCCTKCTKLDRINIIDSLKQLRCDQCYV